MCCSGRPSGRSRIETRERAAIAMVSRVAVVLRGDRGLKLSCF